MFVQLWIIIAALVLVLGLLIALEIIAHGMKQRQVFERMQCDLGGRPLIPRQELARNNRDMELVWL